jgi:hypothetical protein
MGDWIDKLDDESNDDNQTKYQEMLAALFKSRTYIQYGWGHAWDWIIGMVLDDEAEETVQSGYSATYAKEQLEKRLKREE